MPTLIPRCALAAAAVAALAAAAPAQAVPVYGLTTTNQLTMFDSAAPGTSSPLTQITGLEETNERILGIDFRPTNDLLYGVSSTGKLYTLDAATGAATRVGTAGSAGVALASNGALGVDFNPAADLAGAASLRVVGSNGQNIALNASTGATAFSGNLGRTGIGAVAYANNDTDPATGTALYYLDVVNDQLLRADGAFNAPTLNTVGSLGIDATGIAGFDIYGAGLSFAAITDGLTGKTSLYNINLGSGHASLIGDFGVFSPNNLADAPPLLGIAVAPIPEPSTYALMLAGLGAVGLVARRRRPVQTA